MANPQPGPIKKHGPIYETADGRFFDEKTDEEIFKTEGIVSIREYVGHGFLLGPLFIATTRNGDEMIVMVEHPTGPTYISFYVSPTLFFTSEHPFEGKKPYFRPVPWIGRHKILQRGFDGTLIGKWIELHYSHTKMSDWFLVKVSDCYNGHYEVVNPSDGEKLEIIFPLTKKGRRMALKNPDSTARRSMQYESCSEFEPKVELYTDLKGRMCMRIGRFQADEGTLCRQKCNRPPKHPIMMYCTSDLSDRPFPDRESSENYESAKGWKRYRRNQIITDIILAATAPIHLVFLLLGVVAYLIRLLWRKIRPLWRKIRPLRRESCVKRPIVADHIGDPLKDVCYEGTGYPLLDRLFDLYMTLFFA